MQDQAADGERGGSRCRAPLSEEPDPAADAGDEQERERDTGGGAGFDFAEHSENLGGGLVSI